MSRSNTWLKNQLQKIWDRYFPDVPRKNPVTISFGRPSRTRFGSIRLIEGNISSIFINGVFCDLRVPVAVVQSTIAHELTHYLQGHQSTFPKLYRYPHLGGVVEKEMMRRGLGKLLRKEQKWAREEWEKFLKRRSLL